MSDYLVLGIPGITLTVYAVIYALRAATGESEKFKRFIPLISLLLGGILGGLASVFAPALVGESNLLTAVLLGGLGGLAATGGNQIFKQLFEKKDDEEKKQ